MSRACKVDQTVTNPLWRWCSTVQQMDDHAKYGYLISSHYNVMLISVIVSNFLIT